MVIVKYQNCINIHPAIIMTSTFYFTFFYSTSSVGNISKRHIYKSLPIINCYNLPKIEFVYLLCILLIFIFFFVVVLSLLRGRFFGCHATLPPLGCEGDDVVLLSQYNYLTLTLLSSRLNSVQISLRCIIFYAIKSYHDLLKTIAIIYVFVILHGNYVIGPLKPSQIILPKFTRSGFSITLQRIVCIADVDLIYVQERPKQMQYATNKKKGK